MLIETKNKEIENMRSVMKCKQCALLGIMGMARTIQLIKHIAIHDKFQRMQYFEIFIWGGLKKILYNDRAINNKIEKGIEICNSLIPVLKEYDSSDDFDEQDHLLMQLKYSLIEKWYYFIDVLFYDMNSKDCKVLIQYSTVAGERIYAYLRVWYRVKYHIDTSRRVEAIEENPIYRKELDIIDDDIRFVQEKHNNSEIKQRIREYIKYKFWE